ncbi:MAG: hypothetical protein WAX33_10685 [Rectinemataceae bacterium]
MRQFQAMIIDNVPVAPDWRRLSFEWPETLPAPVPGQFFTFRPRALDAEGGGLLRRPLAVAAFADGIAHAVYQLRGPATKTLAASLPGTFLDVIAPLGKGFPLPERGTGVLLAGGGIGIGPVLYLASELERSGFIPGADYELILGFRDAAAIPEFGLSDTGRDHAPADGQSKLDAQSKRGAGILAQLVASAEIRTDDGSAGFRGTALDGLKEAASRLGRAKIGATGDGGVTISGGVTKAGAGDAGGILLCACGPGPMLAALAGWARSEGMEARLSAEQWMACGVGACYGCVLPASAGGYLRACTDGPVFDSRDILWEACP